jgi:zinc D-Ala-D-Ala carboxypeptidase
LGDGEKKVKYFTLDEFKCKHCGQVHMEPDFLEMLDNARGISDVGYIIVSGYRCSSHNKAVGSTSTNHVRGRASDIKAVDGPTRGKILRGLYKAGFVRIGISFKGGFIHADSNDGVESCWDYGG